MVEKVTISFLIACTVQKPILSHVCSLSTLKLYSGTEVAASHGI